MLCDSHSERLPDPKELFFFFFFSLLAVLVGKQHGLLTPAPQPPSDYGQQLHNICTSEFFFPPFGTLTETCGSRGILMDA